MVVAGQLFGQFESTVIVHPCNSSNDAGFDQGGDVSVGARLRKILVGSQDLADGQRSPCSGQRVDEGSPHRGVALFLNGQPQGGLLVHGGCAHAEHTRSSATVPVEAGARRVSRAERRTDAVQASP